MKTPSFQTLRRKPFLALALAGGMLGGTHFYLSSAESRAHRNAARQAAAAHVNFLSSLAVKPAISTEQPSENAAAAVLRASTVSTSALAFVPED